ncbi:MAG: ATP-binding protein, partial [Pseudomonadota bacterium]
IAVERDGGWVRASVEDDGCGLPVGDARRSLTEPYVTTKEKGTGLGLAIVAKVLADHGGDLKLGDRPGGGAVARLKLPAAPADAGVEPTPSPADADAA